MVVMIVEGVAGAAVNATEEIGSSRGIFIKTSVLATREVGLVVMGSSSTTIFGESGLVITIKPVVGEPEIVAGMETGPLENSS